MGITGHTFKKYKDADEEVDIDELDEVTVSIVDFQRHLSMPDNTADSESDNVSEPTSDTEYSDDDYEPENYDDADVDIEEMNENGISEQQDDEEEEEEDSVADSDDDDDDIDIDIENEEHVDDDNDDDDEEDLDSDSSSVKSLEAGRDEEEEDDLIKKIKEMKKIKKQQPPDIKIEEDDDTYVSSLSFSPSNDIIAVGNSEGDISLYSYDLENTAKVLKYSAHNGSCRKIEFDENGDLIYSISNDKTIIVADANSGKYKNSFDNAHENPIHSLYVINKNLLCTGDDDGVVKLWDRRKRTEVFTMKISDDYISSLRGVDESSTLACTSGDGTISGLNVNTRKIMNKSEPYTADITCSGLFCSNTKLAVGTSIGSLLLYSWSQFTSWNDEFPAVDRTKRGISGMVPITENIVITGLDDGKLRATHLFPMRHIGIVGHQDGGVEGIDINRGGSLIATHSFNKKVCFWNVEYFEDINLTDKTKKNNEKAKEHNLPSSSGVNARDFFAGLA